MEGVSLYDARAVYHALLHGERLLYPDGTTKIAIKLEERDAFATEGAAVGHQLVLCDRAECGDGAISVAAGQHDFVTRVSDGRLLYVLEVRIVDGGVPMFIVEEPKPWKLPRPPPPGADVRRKTLTAAADAPPAVPLELCHDEIRLAAEYSTFDTAKTLVVMPITAGTGRSYAQLLGAAPLTCASTAMDRAVGAPGEVASRRATHFFSWSFAQQFGRYVEAFAAFLADDRQAGVDANRVYTWISPLSEDQYAASDFKKEDWAAIFEQRLHDIGHLVLLFSPWYDAAPLGRIWCLWEIFISASADDVTITVQLPPRDEATLTRALLHSEISAKQLLKSISTREADARDPAAKAMILSRIEANGGHEAVDAVIRKELERAFVIESKSSAISAASRSELRAVVLTERQGALVRRIFGDIEADAWRRGRWHLSVPASSGKSYIAVHLAGQWATAQDGGPTLYLCHHSRMQQQVLKQIELELRNELSIFENAVFEEAFSGPQPCATWVRAPPSAPEDVNVLVATIDGVIDFSVTDTIAQTFIDKIAMFTNESSARKAALGIADNIAGYLRGAAPDLHWEASRPLVHVMERPQIVLTISDFSRKCQTCIGGLAGIYNRTTIEVGGTTRVAWRFAGADGCTLNPLFKWVNVARGAWGEDHPKYFSDVHIALSESFPGGLVVGSLAGWIDEGKVSMGLHSDFINQPITGASGAAITVEEVFRKLDTGEPATDCWVYSTGSTTSLGKYDIAMSAPLPSDAEQGVNPADIAPPVAALEWSAIPGMATTTEVVETSSDAWTDYARLCFVCATSKRWRSRFQRGGVIADECHLICGRDGRPDVAGQHRVAAVAVGTLLNWWAGCSLLLADDNDVLGRLALLGDENQLNLSRQLVTPPVYPLGCEKNASNTTVDVDVLLQTNLRNPHTVRDSAAMFYNEFAQDGTLQPLHPSSAEGRALETVEVTMTGWSGGTRREGSDRDGKDKYVNVMHATAENYGLGVAWSLVKLHSELTGVSGDNSNKGFDQPSAGGAAGTVLDHATVAVLTPQDHELWGNPQHLNATLSTMTTSEQEAAYIANKVKEQELHDTFRQRLRIATMKKLRDISSGGVLWGLPKPEPTPEDSDLLDSVSDEEESSEEAFVVGVVEDPVGLCEDGHPLTRTTFHVPINEESPWHTTECDFCGETTSTMRGCLQCDFDVCSACFTEQYDTHEEDSDEEESGEEGSFEEEEEEESDEEETDDERHARQDAEAAQRAHWIDVASREVDYSMHHASAAAASTSAAAMPSTSLRGVEAGVQVGWLRKFVRTLPLTEDDDEISSMSTLEVVLQMVKPATMDRMCRYVALLEPGEAGRAEVFVSHTWRAPFRDLVAAVTHVLEDSAFVWIDIFAVLQWNEADGLAPAQIAEKIADLDFAAVVQATQGVLLVATPIPELEEMDEDDFEARRVPDVCKQSCAFFRVWCLVELAAALEEKIPVVLLVGTSLMRSASAKNAHYVLKQLCFKPDESEMLDMLFDLLDVAQAAATFEEDRERILNDIRKGCGIEALNSLGKGAVSGAFDYMMQREVIAAALGNRPSLLRLQNSNEWSENELQSMLNAACGGGLMLPFEALMARGDIDIDRINPEDNAGGWSALNFAIRGGHIGSMSKLLEAGFDCTGDDTIFLDLVQSNYGEMNPKLAEAMTALLKKYGAVEGGSIWGGDIKFAEGSISVAEVTAGAAGKEPVDKEAEGAVQYVLDDGSDKIAIVEAVAVTAAESSPSVKEASFGALSLLSQLKVAVKIQGKREVVTAEEEWFGSDDADFEERLKSWRKTNTVSVSAAASAGAVLAAMEDVPPGGTEWLVWESVENFVGLDIPLVIMAGFDPLGARNASSHLNYKDPLSYMAMTRATYGTVVVEPHAKRFSRHYRIPKLITRGESYTARAIGEGDEDEEEEEKADTASTDGEKILEEMAVLIDSSGKTRLFPSSVTLKPCVELPASLFDPLRASGLRRLTLTMERFNGGYGRNTSLTRKTITTLPDEIGMLTALTTLIISDQDIATLPDSIVALTQLEILDIEGNPLLRPQTDVVEAWLCALDSRGCKTSSKRFVDNSRNGLPWLCDGAATCTKVGLGAVTYSDRFVFDDIAIIKAVAAAMPCLTELHLGCMPMLPVEVLSEIDALQVLIVHGTEHLDRRERFLFSLPDSIGILTTLTELDVSSNRLETLPDSLGDIVGLTSLDISGNNLLELPEVLSSMVGLRQLFVGNNMIERLPEWIGELAQLTELDLQKRFNVSTPFGEMPGSFAKLIRLRTLCLDVGGFGDKSESVVPDAIFTFTDLTSLDLCSNNLTSIPDSFAGLTKMETLRLQNNMILTLPDSMAAMKFLKRLDLQSNPIDYEAQSDTVAAWLTSLERPWAERILEK